MGQNFDQAKRDNTFWPRPNILHPSVCRSLGLDIYVREFQINDYWTKAFS